MRVNKSDDERLDEAIDVVARQMLGVEPATDLRARVLDRLASPRRRPLWMPLAAAAAAAVLLFAVLWPRLVDHVSPIPGRDMRLPVQTVIAEQPHVEPPAVRVASTARPSAARVVRATVLDEPPPDEGAVPALESPAPIALQRIGNGQATPISAIDVPGIGIPALELNALPEAPVDRREE
jgi:hypothetical protein